ncbi:hypothetical protein [Pseudomonas sp. TCU-HL1]|nr:hypothetical protein [Pseudomonas sp. TCU-HL1]
MNLLQGFSAALADKCVPVPDAQLVIEDDDPDLDMFDKCIDKV